MRGIWGTESRPSSTSAHGSMPWSEDAVRVNLRSFMRLRLAARREDELTYLEARSGPRLTFERFNRVPSNRMDEGGLTDKTKIQWTVMRDGVRHRVHWQQDGAGIVVEDETGSRDWMPSPAQTVSPDRFPLRVFSQGQIAELAGDSQQTLLQVIDEAAGVSAHREQLNEARHAFFASRARIRELGSGLITRR